MKVCNRSFLRFSFSTSKGNIIIDGKHQSAIKGAEYYVQDIDDSVWREIAEKYKELGELKEGIIFALESEKEVHAKAKDLVKKKVGDEKVKPSDILLED